MKKLLFYYSFIVITIMTLMGFLGAKSYSELLSAVLFFPLAYYLWLGAVPRRKKAISFPDEEPDKSYLFKKTKLKKKEEIVELTKEVEEIDFAAKKGKLDKDRRMFLKLIGSAGMTVFFFSIFTKRAQAAFFGSVPGPGVVGIKDSAGVRIDPKREHPTDGYRLSDLDDTSPTNSFYGFTNAAGAWFIIRESSSGDFRYTRGATDYTNATTGWPNRTNLSYNYYENVF